MFCIADDSSGMGKNRLVDLYWQTVVVSRSQADYRIILVPLDGARFRELRSLGYLSVWGKALCAAHETESKHTMQMDRISRCTLCSYSYRMFQHLNATVLSHRLMPSNQMVAEPSIIKYTRHGIIYLFVHHYCKRLISIKNCVQLNYYRKHRLELI